jgi:hypothetical protein
MVIIGIVALQVKNVVEMPHNDHLPLIEASRYVEFYAFD